MSMPFGALAHTLEALEPITGRTQMIGILAELLAAAKPDEVGPLVYLTQGRLLPDFIQEEFGVNERLIFRAVAQAFSSTPQEVQAVFKQLGDAGLTAQEFALRAGQETESRRTLAEVYNDLISITKAVGSGSQEAKVSLLSGLLGKLSPLEGKHVSRMVVGRLRVGVGDPTLMDALSFATAGDKSLRGPIERAYNLTSDLGLVARTLYSSGVGGLEEIQVKVGNPVRMALAERADSAEEIVTRLGECAIEPKFDGFRMQIHKSGDDVAIFSRGLENMSGMYPDVVAAVRKQLGEKSAILEGEALAYDPESGLYQPFQVTSQRRRVHNIEAMSATHPLRLMAFDMLLVDGQDLTRAPFTERRAALTEALGAHDGMGGILPSQMLVTADPEQIVAFYEECLMEGFEGIVAKRLSGTYDAGKRGFNWIKMKRSYNTQLRDTVDCVIVGYYYGKGRRATWGIGSLLVAAYDKATDTLPTVTRVASGLSDEGWRDLCRRLEVDRIEHNDPLVRSVVTPDVWVVPRVVVELQADEVSRSQMHLAGKTGDEPGYALRFPRILKERPERTPQDASSVEEIIRLYNMQGKGDMRGMRKKSETSETSDG